jgi:hypothetical protein
MRVNDPQAFFMDTVLPQIDGRLTDDLRRKYARVSLYPQAGFVALRSTPMLMLAALTGTGKSTTLDALAARRSSGEIDYVDDIPSRREVADLIAIPTAQALLKEAIEPVKDRTARFRYTRTFAESVAGGMARAFSWLYYRPEGETPIVSEGIRGGDEIGFALENYPAWRIAELALNPLTRLQRLSTRNDGFDQAAGSADVSFLPEAFQEAARAALARGEISPKALSIMEAEAASYGLTPCEHANGAGRYRRIEADGLTVDEITDQIVEQLKRMRDADD